ncbi:anaphase-promoting complex subunit 5 isoform X2 [Curcuma longa]|uniref:anaphase-promoting complex subunit 5 isoform X2 n=1 Tax=Curcuma longa TaxID=136217 RepID=UPI003D9EE65E
MSPVMGGGGSTKEGGSEVFDITPHKIAVCHLVQLFAQPPLHCTRQSISEHQRLGLFLFSLTRSCEGFFEPTLDEFMNQLKAVDHMGWLSTDLIANLSALSSPDDLFNFFDKLRGVLSGPEGSSMEDEQIYLDPNGHLGIFLRCCILAFNMLSFEGVCHLWTNLAAYCNSNGSMDELAEENDFDESENHELQEYPELDCEPAELDEYSLENTAQASENLLNVRAKLLSSFPEDNQTSFDLKMKHVDVTAQSGGLIPLLHNFRRDDSLGILRSRWQIEGYLNVQADLLEKNATSFPLNSLAATLKQLQKLAPELHRVHYLQYLNALYHDDYVAALDNLHCYFDNSAGMEGLFNRSAAPSSEFEVGKYETALLCLGSLHSHFGHPKKALEALTEAVRVSQQNNDDACLAYTLAAICKLLSEVGVSNMTGIIGSPYFLGTSTGLATPLSTQKQLLVLLKRSLGRANHLKLTNLLAFNRLAMAKFDLKHVKKPLISFGPKASMKLKTCPISVCKELRLSSKVLSEFGADGILQLNDTGAFSTSWLKNLLTVDTPWLKSHMSRSLSANDFDVFQFHAQPSPIPGSVLQLAGASYLLRSTAWEYYGSSPLVRMNALVYATCFADAASSSELSLAYAKLIQHLSVFKGYTEAFNALKLAEKKFSSSSNQHIQILKLQLLHERALHRGNLKAAQQICDKFGVLASSISGVDMDLKTEAGLRNARTLLAANQFSQAAAVASNLFSTCYKFNMQVENATVLLLLAEIHKKAGDTVLGLPYALASLSFCKIFNLDLLKASATIILAELWLALGSSHAKKALSLVHLALPMILGHGGLELRARANIALAKCLLSDPSFSISEDPDSVLDPLSQASEELQILEYHEMAAEAFYLMAIVYDKLGRLDEREESASSFRKHLLALENPEDEEDL